MNIYNFDPRSKSKMEKPIITLTTDWGMRDFYTGAVKGKLLSKMPHAQVVDISHQIAPHDIIHASFVLKNAFPQFPEGTIHLIGVDNNTTYEQPHTLIKTQGQYFIGTDNGIFSLMFRQKPETIIHIDTHQESDYFTFPVRDLFCKVAAELIQGKPPGYFGNEADQIRELQAFQPVILNNTIKAKVIHVDRYKNLITNISLDTFQKVGKGKPFVIHFHGGRFNIQHINTEYNEVNEAEIVAIFGSSGFLEIALNKGKASELLGMDLDSPVILEFQK